MTVRMIGNEARLEGDWTESGVAANLDSLLLFLEQTEAHGSRLFCIDCERIDGADMSCLQLLNVWMLCARLRGIEPKLINVNDGMQLAIRKFGLTGFTNSCPGIF